jgi:hypothetical protein
LDCVSDLIGGAKIEPQRAQIKTLNREEREERQGSQRKTYKQLYALPFLAVK